MRVVYVGDAGSLRRRLQRDHPGGNVESSDMLAPRYAPPDCLGNVAHSADASAEWNLVGAAGPAGPENGARQGSRQGLSDAVELRWVQGALAVAITEAVIMTAPPWSRASSARRLWPYRRYAPSSVRALALAESMSSIASSPVRVPRLKWASHRASTEPQPRRSTHSAFSLASVVHPAVPACTLRSERHDP